MDLPDKLAVFYHDFFDYPLTKEELKRWKTSRNPKYKIEGLVSQKGDYFFLKGREGIIKKRLQREKFSKSKIKIARAAAECLMKLPTIKMIGITGSLAMMNARKNSDIDLIMITKKDTLWMTRLIAYLLLFIAGFNVRRPKVKNEKDKLCLNIWLDESDLCWQNYNIFTAHEVAQIVPIVNKNRTYQRFIFENIWIFRYWPNAAGAARKNYESRITNDGEQSPPLFSIRNSLFKFVELLAFKMQYFYMKPKVTREVVTEARAIFHPVDWSGKVLDALDKSY